MMVAVTKDGILTYEFKFGHFQIADFVSFVDSCKHEMDHRSRKDHAQTVFITCYQKACEQYGRDFVAVKLNNCNFGHKYFPEYSQGLNPLS